MTQKPAYEELERRVQELEKQVQELERDEAVHNPGQETYRDIFAAAKDTFLIFDMNGIIREVNPAASLMYGYNRDEIIGLTGKDIVHPDYHHLFKEFVDRASEGTVFSAESVDIRKDGTTFPVEVRGSGLTFNGKPHLLSVVRDITDRKQAEEALQQERNLLRRVVETSPDGITIVNHQGQITFANAQAERELGLSKKDITQRTYNQPDWYITDYDGNPFPDEKLPFRLVMATCQSVHDVRHAIEWPDGRRIFLSINAAPLFTQSGEISGMVATVEDITDHKLANQALRESEGKYRLLADNARDVIWVRDMNLKLTYVSPSVEMVRGYTPEEALNQNLNEVLTSESAHIAVKRYSEILNDLKNDKDLPPEYSIELEHKCKDGGTIWMECRISPLKDTEGKLTGILGVSRDITERRQSEKAIRESRERFQKVFNSQLDAIFVLSDDLPAKIIECNHALSSIFHYSIEEVIGKSTDFLHVDPSHLKEFQSRLRSAIEKDGYLTGFEFSMKRKDGTIFPSEHTVFELKNDAGQRSGWVSVVRDLTDRKRLESQLKQAQKMEAIGTLAGGIAHDYNNLLSIIVGNLQLARQDAEPGSDQAVFLDEAGKAARKVGHLTHELMSLSRGGAPIKKLGSVNALVRTAATGLPKDSGISLNQFISPDLWPVPHDANKIEAVFRNVVQNALEAMPEGGPLTIRAENLRVQDDDVVSGLSVRPGDYVRISIQDEGRGIPNENLDKIFDPYFSTKPMGVQKGMGLGLATSHAIVQKHGGHITVNSTPGVGTKVSIYLPAARKEAPKEERKEVELTTETRFRVLLMDDEEMLRKLGKQMLNRLGYHAETVKDGVEAIEIYTDRLKSDQPFDAVILDLTVKGGMGGEQTIQELRKIDPDVKAIVSSGYFNDPVMANFEDYGFMGSMAKPYEMKDVKTVLKKVFRVKD